MSRIGKAPIPIPDKVTVNLSGLAVTVKGPKGELSRTLPEGVSISQDGDQLLVAPTSEARRSRERHGLSRTLVANMIEGVSQGFTRKLEIVGVGYRAQVQGKKLVVSAGYSHPVEMVPPDGVTFAVENNTTVIVSGADKEVVGNEAAKVRAIRKPEPYKGKGIKYEGERILRKVGKTGSGLADLPQNPFSLVFDALALVGLRFPNRTHLGGLIAHHLLVGTGDDHRGVVLHRKGDAIGGNHFHRMAVAGADHELFALHLGPVTHAHDLELAGEPLAHPLDHVGHQGSAQAVPLPGTAGFAGGRNQKLVAILADTDPLGQGAAELTLGPLDGDSETGEVHRDLVGNGDGGFTNA